MKNSKIFFALIAPIILAFPYSATAGDLELKFKVIGEAFEGNPILAIESAGQIIAEQELDKAMDTAKMGRFSKDTDLVPFTQELTVTLNRNQISGDSLNLFIANDKWGGKGSNKDRNIRLLEASVNGQVIKAQDIPVFTNGKFVKSNANWIGLFSRSDIAQLPITTNSKVKPKAANPNISNTPLKTAKVVQAHENSNDALTVTSQANADNKEVKASKAKEQPNTAGNGIKSASPKPTAKEAQGCRLNKSIAVTSFGNAQLTIADNDKLDVLINELKNQRCTITIHGYASKAGSAKVNQYISDKRAQFVFDHLKKAGVNMQKAMHAGKGETRQFGRARANRRVVITVKK